MLGLNLSPDSFTRLQTYLQSSSQSSRDCRGNISLNWLMAVTPAWLLIERFVSSCIKEPEKEEDMSLNRVSGISPEHYILIESFTFGNDGGAANGRTYVIKTFKDRLSMVCLWDFLVPEYSTVNCHCIMSEFKCLGKTATRPGSGRPRNVTERVSGC